MRRDSIMNGAILLLLLIGAPNFRPRFRYFNKWTAGVGLLIPLVAMFGISERLTLIFIGMSRPRAALPLHPKARKSCNIETRGSYPSAAHTLFLR